jgi:hypothetical protein
MSAERHPCTYNEAKSAGHAVRMAIDMGLNRSFLHLLRTGVGKGKSQEELEEERYLVVQSRIWFCVRHLLDCGRSAAAI